MATSPTPQQKAQMFAALPRPAPFMEDGYLIEGTDGPRMWRDALEVWVSNNAQTQALIDRLDSAQAEGSGWDAVVKAELTFGNVVRTSERVVTITLPAFPGYSITRDETITATIPASALDFPIAIGASPTFLMVNLPGVAGEGVAFAQRHLLFL